MKQAHHNDPRTSPRAPMGVVVRVETSDGTFHYQSKDLSAGGVFLLTENPLDEETKVKLDIILPSISTPVRASGEVVWKQRQEPSGFAVKFTDINEGGQKLIRMMVRRYLEKNS